MGDNELAKSMVKGAASEAGKIGIEHALSVVGSERMTAILLNTGISVSAVSFAEWMCSPFMILGGGAVATALSTWLFVRSKKQRVTQDQSETSKIRPCMVKAFTTSAKWERDSVEVNIQLFSSHDVTLTSTKVDPASNEVLPLTLALAAPSRLFLTLRAASKAVTIKEWDAIDLVFRADGENIKKPFGDDVRLATLQGDIQCSFGPILVAGQISFE